MVIARRTFFCKVGHANQVVDTVKGFFPLISGMDLPITGHRVCTDLTGRTDRVIWDMEAERLLDPTDLADRAANHPEFGRWFQQLAEHIVGAEAEYLKVEVTA